MVRLIEGCHSPAGTKKLIQYANQDSCTHSCVCVQETHIVPEGVSSDRILCGQRDATENDEDQDEIGEDVMMDQGMTAHSYPAVRHTQC